MNKFFLVLWVFVVAIFLWFHFYPSDTKPVQQPPADTGDQTSPVSLYINDEFGFSLNYPEHTQLKFGNYDGFLPVTSLTAAGIMLDSEQFAGTNLVEAGVFVGVSPEPGAVSVCEKYNGATDVPTGKTSLNGEDFYMFERISAGAGNIYDLLEFRKIKNGSCYEIVALLHSGNIDNYAPGTIKEYDKQKYAKFLEDIVKSFKFTVSNSGVIGQITLGPSCPVERIPPDPNCAPKPYQTKIDLTNHLGSGVIASTESDENGRFKIDIAPGKYDLHAGGGKILPRCAPQTVEIKAENFIYTALSCDTGIR